MQAPTQMQMTAPTIKMIIRLPAPAVAAVWGVAVGASVGPAVGAGNVGTGTGAIVIDGAAVDGTGVGAGVGIADGAGVDGTGVGAGVGVADGAAVDGTGVGAGDGENVETLTLLTLPSDMASRRPRSRRGTPSRRRRDSASEIAASKEPSLTASLHVPTTYAYRLS